MLISCPYCWCNIKKYTSSKFKCDECKKIIYTRIDYKNKEEILLREDDLDLYEKEKKNYSQEKAFVRDFSQYWVSLNDIQGYKNKASVIFSNHWVYRQVYHEKVEKPLLEKLRKNVDVFHDLKMVNYRMWLWMYRINEKKMGFHYFQESVKWEVAVYKIVDDTFVRDFSIHWFESLPIKFQKYKNIADRKYSLDEFLEEMPIPIQEVCDEMWTNLLCVSCNIIGII